MVPCLSMVRAHCVREVWSGRGRGWEVEGVRVRGRFAPRIAALSSAPPPSESPPFHRPAMEAHWKRPLHADGYIQAQQLYPRTTPPRHGRDGVGQTARQNYFIIRKCSLEQASPTPPPRLRAAASAPPPPCRRGLRAVAPPPRRGSPRRGGSGIGVPVRLTPGRRLKRCRAAACGP